MRRLGLVAVVAAGLTSLGLAGPLDRAIVSRDAQWVVHVDMAEVARSTAVRAGYERMGHSRRGMARFLESRLGLDVMDDVGAITTYGLDAQGDHVVTVVEASEAVERALERAEQRLRGFETEVVGSVRVHSWDSYREGRTYAALWRPHVRPAEGAGAGAAPPSARRLLVLASSSEEVIAGLAVIEGRSASLADGAATDGSVGALAEWAPSEGSALFIATSVIPGVLRSEDASEVARRTKSLVLDLGERGEQFFALLVLNAQDEEDAEHIRATIAEVLSLSEEEDADPLIAVLRPIAEHATVSASGKQVRAEVRTASSPLAESLGGRKPWGGPKGSDGRPRR